MTIGEIYWIEFPPRDGHEQTGRRPAILWQNAAACAALPTVLVIPLTTQVGALRFPGTVLIEQDIAALARLRSVPYQSVMAELGIRTARIL